jgi:hypothetical protein
VERAFEQSRASSERAGPDWADYVGALALRFAEWFGEAVTPVARALGITDMVWLGRAALFLAAITLVLLFIRLLVALRSAQRPSAPLPSPVRVEAPVASGSERRREAEVFLMKGDVARALASVWWWFAEAALKQRPEPMMTTNDVLTRSRRADLRPRAQKLDRFRFSGQTPTIADVRELITSFESGL